MLSRESFKTKPKILVEEVKLNCDKTYIKELLASEMSRVEEYAYYEEGGKINVNTKKYKFALIALSLCDSKGSCLFDGVDLKTAVSEIQDWFKGYDLTTLETRIHRLNNLDKALDDIAGKS